MPEIYEGNPRMSFSWRITVDGLQSALAQRVTLPDAEIAEAKVGGVGKDRKVPGKINFTDCTIEKLKPLGQADTFGWDLLTKARSPKDGSTTDEYEVTFDVEELGADGEEVVERHTIKGWVKAVRQSTLDKTQDGEPMIESIILAVNEYERS